MEIELKHSHLVPFMEKEIDQNMEGGEQQESIAQSGDSNIEDYENAEKNCCGLNLPREIIITVLMTFFGSIYYW